MADQLSKAEEFEKKAEKKLSYWGLFSSKYEDAADLFDKAANSFKLAKSWDKAGATYLKLANCHLELESKHEAAQAYVDAAHCYKKTNITEAVSCLEHAASLFCDIGRFSMAARYFKEIAELYDEKAADFFQTKEVRTTADQCEQKVAQFAAQLDNLLAPLDKQTPTFFDNLYFNNLVDKRGLLHSDQELFNGSSTDHLVKKYDTNATAFFNAFAKGMVKMSKIKPLTGSKGQIRINCRKVKLS